MAAMPTVIEHGWNIEQFNNLFEDTDALGDDS